MPGVGFIADRIGRKWGSVLTASAMLVGARSTGRPAMHAHVSTPAAHQCCCAFALQSVHYQ